MKQGKFLWLLVTLLVGVVSCSHLPGTSKDQAREGNENGTMDGVAEIKGDLGPVGNKGQSVPDIPVKKFRLKNGLTVLISENHQLPITSYYTFFDIGGRHEKPGITGATHFLEHLMFKGAKKYGPGVFDTTIEKNGGSTNAYTSMDSTVYHQKFPSHLTKKIIEMEADRMGNLLLEPAAFEKERQVILEERKMRYENRPSGKLYLAMMQEVFKDTPYGGSVIGDIPDLKGVTREQIWDHFRRYYAPNNAVIVIVGDVDSQQVIRWINHNYGAIAPSKNLAEYKQERDDPTLYTHRARFGRSVNIHGGSPSPMFMLAYKGEAYGTRNSYVMDLISSILGSGTSSYLNQRYVQGKKPRLASVYSGNYTLKHSGVFYIGGRLLPRTNLKSLKRSLLRDVKRSCTKMITDRNHHKILNHFLHTLYHGLGSNSGVASFLGNYEFLKGDYAHYRQELAIYSSITLEEMRQGCRTLFNPGQYIFVSLWNKHPAK